MKRNLQKLVKWIDRVLKTELIKDSVNPFQNPEVTIRRCDVKPIKAKIIIDRTELLATSENDMRKRLSKEIQKEIVREITLYPYDNVYFGPPGAIEIVGEIIVLSTRNLKEDTI